MTPLPAPCAERITELLGTDKPPGGDERAPGITFRVRMPVPF
jgi:hypothetical protein